MMQSSHISVSLDIKTLIFLEEAFPTNTPAQLPHFGLFPYLKSTMQHLSADGLLPGSEDDDDGASSAEQSTEQVPAQQPEQPSQPASEPSLQEKPEDPPLRLSRHSSQQLQQHLPSSFRGSPEAAFAYGCGVNSTAHGFPCPISCDRLLSGGLPHGEQLQ